MDALTDLEVVRRRLDSLADFRLHGPFDAKVEKEYAALCLQERELLRSVSRGEQPAAPTRTLSTHPCDV